MRNVRIRNLIAAGLAAVTLGAVAQPAAPTLGGPLVLRDQGSFFVGGQKVSTGGVPTAQPLFDFLKPGEVTVGQMYVQYLIPEKIAGPAVVMMHGFNHTGATFETTPDGREGWATYFARKGHPVYVVDQPGRGRSGFDPTSFNRAKTSGDASGQPAIPFYPLNLAWYVFRFGETYPSTYPGMQFPVEAINQYAMQLVPNLDNTLRPDAAASNLALLLDRIGPAVVMVHSQAGGIGMDAARLRSEKILAMVNLEGNCAPMNDDEAQRIFSRFPYLALWADFSQGNKGPVGDVRRNGCSDTVKRIQDRRGRADMVFLGDRGLKGHSHMMMMDKGNLAVADVVIDWLDKNVRNAK